MTSLTNDDIKALLELEQKATPIPWTFEVHHPRYGGRVSLRNPEHYLINSGSGFSHVFLEDAATVEFTARFRNAAPAILKELLQLRRVKEAFVGARGDFEPSVFVEWARELVSDGYTQDAFIVVFLRKYAKALRTALTEMEQE